ncbi:hypothetical protein B0T14DRAFT_526498 [Immersiella caudata]|uniref:Uncharacterized protein n=1 Tax=Immersiella caudata TaxID=314043 RepID=A0AA39WDU6_9PEZI|nr:hypothetical protein B0T14DRAFT_526498 [Immersiella caudata]
MKISAILSLLGLALSSLAQELAPSPTESIGCVPHDDHWHCEGPRPVSTAQVTTPVAPSVVTTTAPSGEDHTDAPGTADPGPSPTESIGCEPHGDHWHCDGPVNTLTTATTPTTPTTTRAPVVTAGAAAGPILSVTPLLGLAALAVLGL